MSQLKIRQKLDISLKFEEKNNNDVESCITKEIQALFFNLNKNNLWFLNKIIMKKYIYFILFLFRPTVLETQCRASCIPYSSINFVLCQQPRFRVAFSPKTRDLNHFFVIWFIWICSRNLFTRFDQFSIYSAYWFIMEIKFDVFA